MTQDQPYPPPPPPPWPGPPPGTCYRWGRPIASHRCPGQHPARPSRIIRLIIGIITALAVHFAAAQCAQEIDPLTGPGTCTGVPVIAYHLHALGVTGGLVCAGIGLILALI